MYRVGATSYVIPDQIVPNVEFLGPLVDDVQLVLFETDEHGSNLPGSRDCERLASLAHEHDLTYTVHLPLDVLPGADEASACLVKALRVIDATRSLEPQAYTLHLDGRAFTHLPPGAVPDQGLLDAWLEAALGSLEKIAGWVGRPGILCIENLEAWDPGFFAPLLERIPVSRTADVGHLWLQGVDPVPDLALWLPRTRVVHLHGVAARDHASLSNVPPEKLDPVVDLLEREFTGIVTLEVFSEPDLRSSLDALGSSRTRVRARIPSRIRKEGN
jgi:sugar phosphate isomerase/epimerase